MVLQASNIHDKRRDMENRPPVKHSVVSKIKGLSRQRVRARATPGSPRFLHDASRRSKARASSSTLRFQVPPTPVALPTPADVEMTDAAPAELPTTTVTLPRLLAHPQRKEVPRETMTKIDPTLENVPMDFTRDVLKMQGPHMLKVLSSVQAEPARNALPKELPIVVNDLSCDLPTHMMAVWSRLPTSLPKRKVTLYPVHNMILAAHCANLPALPESHPQPPSTDGESITVPVVPLGLPSPHSFPQLTSYLYTKRVDTLLLALLPCAPPAPLQPSPDSEDREAEQKAMIAQFARKLSATFTPHALLQRTLFIYGMWKNVCALGIFDDNLWLVMELAWEVMMCAMAYATGNTSVQPMPPMYSPSPVLPETEAQ
ncbi:hypothetical protein EVG20_g3079 [Dentipellis fragilis]|uniref:Uncharacterized protein n=1 Tax=Dentipellis fragilis TaxID=205917 RepID=A0A4Y9Z8A8_9AGAM|nr:hypothetical protein EVG20_g3079 [Dentipellis fragilis]